MIDDNQIDWYCWMLVNGRNNWWHPDETGRDCAEAMEEDATEIEIEKEQAVHWAKFNVYQELIHSFGKALIWHYDEYDTDDYFNREETAKIVEERARREIEQSREEGLDLPDEKTRAELKAELEATEQ